MARRAERTQRALRTPGHGTPATAAGLLIVRAEHQGPTGFLITVTRTPDVTTSPAKVTSSSTVEVEVAVEELRSFLNAFRRGP